ncbi:entericidin A/B family lipoprotein [Pokkaliibacter sp. CJK22405]
MAKIAAIIVMVLGVSLAGCNTMSGLGQDIQKGGAAIQKAAQ